MFSRPGITMTCQNCFQKGHNKNVCKNPTIVLPPEPPPKKGRPKKAQVGVSSLVDEDLVDAGVDSAPIVDDDYVEAPFLHEQTSQFEVRGWGVVTVEVKGLRLRLGERELGIEGDLHYFSALVDWVHGLMLDKVLWSVIAMQKLQPLKAAKHQTLYHNTCCRFRLLDITAKPRINFVSPRARSERIIKKKLSKNHFGTGSSNSNAFDSRSSSHFMYVK